MNASTKDGRSLLHPVSGKETLAPHCMLLGIQFAVLLETIKVCCKAIGILQGNFLGYQTKINMYYVSADWIFLRKGKETANRSVTKLSGKLPINTFPILYFVVFFSGDRFMYENRKQKQKKKYNHFSFHWCTCFKREEEGLK